MVIPLLSLRSRSYGIGMVSILVWIGLSFFPKAVTDFIVSDIL
jgi:hypothetical protein